MKMKLLAGALAALSLTGPVQAAEEFSDANAVSKRLQFIASAVEFGFDLKALEVSADLPDALIDRPVATFEVTSSEPRQLAIGWDVPNNSNMTYSFNQADTVTVKPLKGGTTPIRFGQMFYFEETTSGVAMQNITDGPLRLQVTTAPVEKIAGTANYLSTAAFENGPGGITSSNTIDGTYRLSMVAAVYNP